MDAKCNYPCEDYPYCKCVPDVEHFFEEAEKEDAEFSNYECKSCGYYITECICDKHQIVDDSCPNCGMEYDEIDYEYQICHYCKFQNINQ